MTVAETDRSLTAIKTVVRVLRGLKAQSRGALMFPEKKVKRNRRQTVLLVHRGIQTVSKATAQNITIRRASISLSKTGRTTRVLARMRMHSRSLLRGVFSEAMRAHRQRLHRSLLVIKLNHFFRKFSDKKTGRKYFRPN
jgi:hypothetical protein